MAKEEEEGRGGRREGKEEEDPIHHHLPFLDSNRTQIQFDVVFPPSNHEGLHHHHLRGPHSDVAPPPENSQPQSGRDYVCSTEAKRWVGFGFGILRARALRFISCVWSSFSARRGVNWSFGYPVAAVLVWWFYVAVRKRRSRRRLRVQEESRDHLVLLLKEKDEKIKQLLHQIAQMNQLLLALHRNSSSQRGET